MDRTEPFHGNVTAQELADMLPTGVVILNCRDETVLSNQHFRELTTCHSAKSFDCWSKSIHPEDYSLVSDAYYEALRARNALRIEYRTRGQMSLWRALVLAPLDDADLQRLGLGSEGGFVCTIADITLEKTADLSQRAIADLAKERFIDMISHEVRNPLSAILHCTEDILQIVKDRNSSQVPLANIMQAAEIISLCVAHQKKILDDFLVFSKLDASMVTLSPKVVQPRRCLGNSLTIFRPELRKQKIQFEYKLDHSYAETGVEWVVADIDRIGQVLIYLVSNSIKFTTNSGGTREIRVSMGASSNRPLSYPPNVVFFDTDEAALRMDATTSPEWGDGEELYM
jgi:signal transduction histidine kinase